MELIIHILMLFIVINCSFKLSFWKLWQTVIYSLIAGLFVAGTWQYAILQSKTQIADYLQNTEALQNMAIIITLESALCFGYCVSRLMKYLVPEDDLRLEVHFLVSLFICILGLLTTVNGKTTYAATEEALNWKAIILSIGLFVILFLIGFAWNKLKWPLLQRKELKKRSKINQ